MELQLALEGNLQEFEDDLVRDVRVAMRYSLEELGEAGKDMLREESEPLGRVGMAWDYTLYPQGRDALADDPAVVLHPKKSAEHILTAHARGERITANGASNLWIPIPDSPADRPKPRGESLVSFIFRRVGQENIFVVPATASRPAMAIAQSAAITRTGNVGRGGRSRLKSGAFRKGTADVPLFWVVPEANLEPVISPERVFRRLEAMAPNIIARELARQLGRAA